MVAGSFFLTPATAIRYERHDRRVRQMCKEEELGIGNDRRKVNINEEYYRLAAKASLSSILGSEMICRINKIMGKYTGSRQLGE